MAVNEERRLSSVPHADHIALSRHFHSDKRQALAILSGWRGFLFGKPSDLRGDHTGTGDRWSSIEISLVPVIHVFGATRTPSALS